MKAWQFYPQDKRLHLDELPVPDPRPNGVVIRVRSAMVLSYWREVLSGELGYAIPVDPFIPGTNAVGVIEAVGNEVFHLRIGQPVIASPHYAVDERTAEPAQILIGLSAMSSSRFDGVSDSGLALQRVWKDGVFAEYAHLPASCVTPLDTTSSTDGHQWLALAKLVVPYGGLLRGQLEAGEVVLVNGASGFFGSGGVLMALAMGAGKVIAAGRNASALDELAKSLSPRVFPVPLTGDQAVDTAKIGAAAIGKADLALDLVGRAKSAVATSAALHSLRRGGRLVLMGSCSEPLPVSMGEMLANNWAILGQFMYPKHAFANLVNMVVAGTLDLESVRVVSFPLAELPRALDAATKMRSLEMVTLDCGG